MMKSTKTYRELRSELDELLKWFEGDELDVDEALEKYSQAEDLINEIENYLDTVKAKITKKIA